jgi:hypothetical protein
MYVSVGNYYYSDHWLPSQKDAPCASALATSVSKIVPAAEAVILSNTCVEVLKVVVVVGVVVLLVSVALLVAIVVVVVLSVPNTVVLLVS